MKCELHLIDRALKPIDLKKITQARKEKIYVKKNV